MLNLEYVENLNAFDGQNSSKFDARKIFESAVNRETTFLKENGYVVRFYKNVKMPNVDIKGRVTTCRIEHEGKVAAVDVVGQDPHDEYVALIKALQGLLLDH